MICSWVPAASLTILCYLLVLCRAQNPCGTDQNPYCAGNDVFEQICCGYPNVCYWANRDGQPACCPWGQVCDGLAPYTTRTTYIPPPTTVHPTTVTTTGPPVSTITSFVGGGGVVVITQPNPPTTITTTLNNVCGGGLCSTITSGVVGVYSTVTQEIGQVFSTVSGVLVGEASPRTFSSATTAVLILGIALSILWAGLG